jgi:hypothetical protein
MSVYIPQSRLVEDVPGESIGDLKAEPQPQFPHLFVRRKEPLFGLLAGEFHLCNLFRRKLVFIRLRSAKPSNIAAV